MPLGTVMPPRQRKKQFHVYFSEDELKALDTLRQRRLQTLPRGKSFSRQDLVRELVLLGLEAEGISID